MTKISGSDAMFQVLYDWGIDHIYGFPGGSFDSTMNAIHNWRDKIKFIEVRHEEAGALAASAEYKISGKPYIWSIPQSYKTWNIASEPLIFVIVYKHLLNIFSYTLIKAHL